LLGNRKPMGKKDSSKTRVVPVFDFLYQKDKTGISWLPKLLSLPQGGNPIRLPANCNFSIEHVGWDRNEMKLDPPISLLSWLIRHPRKPTSGKLSSNKTKAKKRQEWIEGSDSRMAEALDLLYSNPNGEDWHIFEGQSQPDVFIQTSDLLIVIEGKRTERKPTTITKWMMGRHQMLRHIDCGWEIRGKRNVIGFFIVEGTGEKGNIPTSWLDYAKATINYDSIASSLPHRRPEERKSIASCFAGVTTWQLLCREFGIDWKQLPDSCK
jgi:hypothetical protein